MLLAAANMVKSFQFAGCRLSSCLDTAVITNPADTEQDTVICLLPSWCQPVTAPHPGRHTMIDSDEIFRAQQYVLHAAEHAFF